MKIRRSVLHFVSRSLYFFHMQDVLQVMWRFFPGVITGLKESSWRRVDLINASLTRSFAFFFFFFKDDKTSCFYFWAAINRCYELYECARSGPFVSNLKLRMFVRVTWPLFSVQAHQSIHPHRIGQCSERKRMTQLSSFGVNAVSTILKPSQWTDRCKIGIPQG